MKTDETLNLENTPEKAGEASAAVPVEVTGSTANSIPQRSAPSVNGSVAEDEQATAGEISATIGEEAKEGEAKEGTAEPEQSTGETTKMRPRSIMRELVETVAIVVVVFLAVRFLVQNFVVEGDSMLPSLHNEQYLLVNKVAYYQYDSNFFGRLFDSSAPSDMHYLFGGPSRGDIVVFIAPTEPKDFIKRVIGLQGETVEVKADPDPTGRPGSPCWGLRGVY